MNHYRVAMTVTNVEDFYHVAEAVDDETARRFAKEAAEREHPNAFNVKVEYTELLPPERKAKPDPLAVARDIIAGLLDAVDLAATEFAAFSAGPPIDNAETRRAYARARQDFGAKAAAARAFLATKEPTT